MLDMIVCMNTGNSSTEGTRSNTTFVLGGSGFIGSRLVSLLEEAQMPVRIGDLRESGAFPALWTHCDVRDFDSVANAAAKATAIVNLAAEHRDDVQPMSRYYETNVLGAINVCNAARSLGIEKIVFTSSVAVFGFQPTPVDENGHFAPFNEYGKTKLKAEQVYHEWVAENPARTLVIVRPTVVFGEGNRGNVYNLLRQISSGRFFMVGSGQNVKSMAYVGNVAAFLAHCLSFEPGEHIFNYVDGPDMCTQQLVDLIRRELGQSGKVRKLPMGLALAGAHLLDAIASISGRTFPISAIRIRKFSENTRFLAEKAFASGFKPPYTLGEGLSRTIAFELQHAGIASRSPSIPTSSMKQPIQ
jgi:nucleoside-diphosphate-sugar epimerase